MRIVIDAVLCVGHAICEEAAPELFQVDENGLAHARVEEIGEEQLEAAKRAMLRCPAEAIRLLA